jgi:hypothetical protein
MIASPHTKLSQSLPVLKLSPRKPTTQDAIVSPDLLNPRKVQFFTLDTVAKDRELGLQTARIRENIEDSTKQPLSQTTERIEKQRQRRCTPYPVKHETKARIAEGPIVSFQEEGLEMGDAATEQATERIENQRQRRCTPYPVKHETKARIAEGPIVSFQEEGLEMGDAATEQAAERIENQRQRRCTPYPVKHETKARIAEGLIVSFQEKVEEKVMVVDADGLTSKRILVWSTRRCLRGNTDGDALRSRCAWGHTRCAVCIH